jgi:hypothetical protein
MRGDPLMEVDARYRDKDGEISRKHGNELIGTLRITYGSERREAK